MMPRRRCAGAPNVWHQRRAQRVRCMPGLGATFPDGRGCRSANKLNERNTEEKQDDQGEQGNREGGAFVVPGEKKGLENAEQERAVGADTENTLEP